MQYLLGIDCLEIWIDETLLKIIEVLHDFDYRIVATSTPRSGIVIGSDPQFAYHAAHIAFTTRHTARFSQALGQFLLQNRAAMFDNLNELIGTNLGITDGRLERIERHGRRILGVGSR